MKRKWGLIAPFTLLLFFLVMVFGVSVGSAFIPFSHVMAFLLSHLPFVDNWIHPNWNEAEETILAQLRIPRVMLGFIVGASLSIAGVGYQGVLRNPLADPYILGISSGASVGAAGVLILGEKGNLFPLFAVPMAAFVGACLALWAVLLIGRVGQIIRVETLILAGVVVNALFGAILTLILSVSPGNTAQQIIWWMIGSLSLRDWHYSWVSLPLLVFVWGVILYYARDLNALATGDTQAESLGVHVEKTKWVLLIASSLVAASAVSVAGIIGFVGLVVPHICRILFGPDHRILVLFSGVGGGMFLVLCDTISRVIIAPGELFIGVVTALLGAPFFAFLLRSRKQGGVI